MRFLTDPWSWWVTPFTDNEFMRTTLWAVLLTAACTSLVGTWVVLRGMSFLGEALAHGCSPERHRLRARANTTVGAFVAALAMVAGSTSSALRRRCPTTPPSASCSSASSAPPW